MNHALKEIPVSRHHQTPLCLGATAGMRLLKLVGGSLNTKYNYFLLFESLSLLDAQVYVKKYLLSFIITSHCYSEVNLIESERVLKEVKKKLQSYPFLFKEARILSGQAEGAYGWITVNYLLENFIKVTLSPFPEKLHLLPKGVHII